jgi:hypothetical protein
VKFREGDTYADFAEVVTQLTDIGEVDRCKTETRNEQSSPLIGPPINLRMGRSSPRPRSTTGTGETKPGRKVRHMSRSQSETHVPNFHNGVKVTECGWRDSNPRPSVP